MNDFKNKHPQRRSAYTSLDGISRPVNRPNSAGGSIGISKPATPSQQQPRRLDDFSGGGGFKTARNNPVSMPTVVDEPLVIDKKPKKKSLFFRKKTSLDGIGKKRLSRKQKAIRVALVLLLILVLIGGFLFAKGYLSLRKVLSGNGGAAALQQDVDPSRLKGEGDGRVNILVLGRGGEGHEGADLTDTIILASIDPIAKEAALVSIPRDLYVPVPNKGSMKINSVFYTGKTSYLSKAPKRSPDSKKQAEDAGFNLLEKTVEQTFGIPVHYHMMVDFEGFKKAIDTVGGVDINVQTPVQERMRIDGRPYLLDVKTGRQHFDGFRALAYARSRQTSVRGDFDRAERQRLIILALKEKVLSLNTFSNPAKVSQLLDNFGSHVQTNFSVNDMMRLYEISKGMGNTAIKSIGLADPPNNYIKTANVGGSSVVVPTAGVGNYKEIQAYIRNTLKDSFLRNENASVVVLNGTQVSGLASKKGDELKSYGYNVIKVDNAPTKNYTKTVIVDRVNSKKYTKNYLEKRFGATSTGTMPDQSINPENADFVIIIGSDQRSR
jgi:polyisoprenyl-teichoic acid--peptidoglycan teichoic acid transferase